VGGGGERGDPDEYLREGGDVGGGGGTAVAVEKRERAHGPHPGSRLVLVERGHTDLDVVSARP
jgi:hypothetical protein